MELFGDFFEYLPTLRGGFASDNGVDGSFDIVGRVAIDADPDSSKMLEAIDREIDRTLGALRVLGDF